VQYGFGESIRDACGVALLADLQGRSRRDILPLTLAALRRLAHRGAVDADGRTGDGAGVLTQIPFDLLQPELERLGIRDRTTTGVGMLFLPQNKNVALRARTDVRKAIVLEGLLVAGWRAVPVVEEALGAKARACMPRIEQLFVVPRMPMSAEVLEERLFRARRAIERRCSEVYVASLSHRTIVYKALVRSLDLAAFYPDLRRSEYATPFAIAHQRFSTNTTPSWAMAQPFHCLAHNGEINTIDGNRSWMRAREPYIAARFGDPTPRKRRIAPRATSDSASLDEALSIFAMAGRTLPEAVSLLVPPAWENDPRIAGARRALLDAQASRVEPWDGPALLAFGDGRFAGAALDRNGLRPARYVLTTSLFALASEAGVFDIAASEITRRGRIGPGEMLAVDLQNGGLVERDDVLREAAEARPYAEWIASSRSTIEDVRAAAALQVPFINRGSEREAAPSTQVLRAFGYTRDEVQLVLGPMVRDGVEAIASMGDDTPLAVLSSRPRLLFSYFRQRFAQVTNPPIDPLRESAVMSLETRLGRTGNALDPDAPLHTHVQLRDPILKPVEVRALLVWPKEGWDARELSLLFCAGDGERGLRVALEQLLADATQLVRGGTTCLVLSDRGVDAEHAAIPSLLAISALHARLIREGLRLETSLIADAGDVRDEHQLAALLAYGADAVCPWAARAMLSEMVRQESPLDVDDARRRYHGALAKGLLKILSKMGVSALRSYRGAQLFEALGLGADLVDAYFPGTPSAIGGLSLEDIASETLERHARAFATQVDALEESGFYRYRRGAESHAYEPLVVKALHRAAKSGDPLDYRDYAELVHAREPIVLRDLFEFRGAPASTPLIEVEPVETIARRFMTAAMSLGSLSPEAQEVLATAMNRFGGRSNCGEGGELATSRERSHRIKQVASARFGVTAQYLVDADELQIKIAQGSKPGEGGQLPGEKVTPLIAQVRGAAAGTTLISPPPHHDIYSIEDLAQLIYDLKQVNDRATVSVKLVSSAGIGTIAIGVAKAHADAIEISGHDGGTGASPLGSIKHAGTPWELGLAEAHQALVRAGLRKRVRLQVNGGLKTGRDVVIAALLGAEEFGFGTAALVAAGCVMARQCHRNTCPAGIATQREELRAKFSGTADDVIRFFTAVAQETREILALLGARTLREVIGRSDLLVAVNGERAGKTASLQLDAVLASAGETRLGDGRRNSPPETGDALDDLIARQLISASQVAPRDPDRELRISLPISNADRAVGARVAGFLARGSMGSMHVTFRGAAGQSFGAFCVEGMTLALEGVANDGVAKGMSGGTVVIRPRAENADDVLAGNAVLYGATGGRLLLAGRAGERFAVRNSGAHAVVEGTGDHACEYMTAGVVAILGTTGVNVAAGMTGGTLFVLDVREAFVHHASVTLERLTREDESVLAALLRAHREATGSMRAARLLARWSSTVRRMTRMVGRGGQAGRAAVDATSSRN
jgi:glutamate synthase domain-containing protein 2/glutamate synthase domain-containing protein 1/glutamate synthase domain-containing protein 3